MKKIVYLSLSLLLAGTMLVSCNKNNPKDVAKVWLTGFNQMDFDESMKVSTNDTKNLLSSLQELTEKVSDSAKKELKKIKVNVKDVKVTADKAIATYTTSDNPRDQTVNLVKQNDKWLVQFTKTDLMGDMSQKAGTQPAAEDPQAGDTTHLSVPVNAVGDSVQIK
jgi:ElaB/YqjD/DUF883 family membrane-anchored ribosome-binding protein